MAMDARCSECGAVWHGGITCLDHFHQMLAWEFESPGDAGAVHHLTVLCYNLQHPSVYSPDALIEAKALLARYVVDGVSPQQIRSEYQETLDSGTRSYKIRGNPDSYGTYAHPVNWKTTIKHITAGGLDGYCKRVEDWAKSVYEGLLVSGNYSTD